MKRINIFVSGTNANGKVFFVTNSIQELLTDVSKQFEMPAKRIFSAEGGEINDIQFIRDNDILYVSNGTDFCPSGQNNITECSDWVTLNVGGQYFATTKSTLINKEPSSMLALMFTESEGRLPPAKKDQSGAFLIDRSPMYFEPLLNFLRHGQLILNPNINIAGILEEARFYGIEGAVNIIEKKIADKQKLIDEMTNSLIGSVNFRDLKNRMLFLLNITQWTNQEFFEHMQTDASKDILKAIQDMSEPESSEPPQKMDKTKVFLVTHSIDELLIAASAKFEMIAKRIFTPHGGEIDDIKLIRDDDILYVSNGEDFRQSEQNSFAKCSDWVSLNVGGRHFATTRSTLINKEPMSMLARMFSESEECEWRLAPSKKDKTGAFLIDRSPTYFEPLLNYLRHGQLILDPNLNAEGVLEEARFYGIEGAASILEEMAAEEQKRKMETSSLTRRDVLKSIMSTAISSELRFQGVNLVGADLSRLDLRNINFKYANLHGCNLEGANLSGCCLERADLSNANLEGAQLVCVKMLCANLEAANLHSCNFEDPGGLPAIMEGVNLKGANLEGSNMASVNLRVATLKNAILKNCDLRSACLAGADLESCDLSGSDLHEANLRGANLKEAVFDLMLTPLHMSQTIR